MYSLLEQKTTYPIRVCWNKPDVSEDKPPNRATTRSRKLPVTRSTDFFMVNDLRFYNPNIGAAAYIKMVHPKKEGINDNVKKPKKGTVYFRIFHRNIRGLGQKAGELLTHLHPDFPHVMCLTEHHLKYLQLEKFQTENYDLGAHYCRQLFLSIII